MNRLRQAATSCGLKMWTHTTLIQIGEPISRNAMPCFEYSDIIASHDGLFIALNTPFATFPCLSVHPGKVKPVIHLTFLDICLTLFDKLWVRKPHP